MKIAITGAGGFLGTELLRQLAQRKDVTVYAFTFDFERQRDTYIISDNIITLDNSEAEKFDFSDTDVLINCAFPRNVSDDTFAKGLNFLQSVIEKVSSLTFRGGSYKYFITERLQSAPKRTCRRIFTNNS